MANVLTNTSKLKNILFIYWLVVPALFGIYLLLLATTQGVPVKGLFTTVPSLTLSTIIALLSIFQAFILFLVGNVSDCRQSLFGTFLKFSLVQQLLSINVIGFCLTLILYRSLLVAKDPQHVELQLKLVSYSLMGFTGLITGLVTFIRLSI